MVGHWLTLAAVVVLVVQLLRALLVTSLWPLRVAWRVELGEVVWILRSASELTGSPAEVEAAAGVASLFLISCEMRQG